MTAAEWPFLAVLLSQPAPGKGPDRESAPRVRGLGCVMGDTLVTAAYLGDLVDLYLLGDGSPAPLHHVGGDAAVAVMGPVAAKAAPATPGSAAAGVPCRVALVSDSSPRFRLLDGRTGEIGADGRFTVELDGRLGEDETAGGSPVVAADGTVVGVVGPTATSTSVDAVALRRAVAGEAADGAAVRSIATQRALDYAVALVTSTSLGAAPSLILGVLRSVDARRTVPRAVHDLVAERAEPAHGKRPGETIDAIVAALGFPVPAYPPPAPEHDAFTRPDLGPLVGEAEAARIRLGADDRLHRRHLLAAALMRPPAEFPERLIALLGTSLPELRAELRAAIAQTDEPQAAWDALLAGPAPEFTLAGGLSSDLVDATKGIPLDRDRLGVASYATMFAKLIAARTTPMPLSIGLFGEWGSGKSYFMGMLRAQVAERAGSGDSRYHGEIVQIGFNAWHYADSNLWASLGDEIFEQLAGPGETDQARRERLRADLAERLQCRQELQAATARAKDETARLAAALDVARAERERSGQTLVKAVLGTEALHDELERAWQRIGVADEAEQARLLAAELTHTRADAAVVRSALPTRRWVLLLAGLVVAAAAIAAGLLASRDLLAGGGLVLLTTVVTAAGWLMARVRSGARLLHQVADGVRRERASAVADELARLRRAEAGERVLQAQLDEVIGQVGQLGRELSELEPGQRLYRFVAERAASESYRGQLGLISIIRKDFEQLIALMEAWRREAAAGGQDAPRPIDRIVLYIDDLDRCSSDQVVEVLQAVHLLLALDLFVVVVGVDPRWLLRSLSREYRSELEDGASAPAGDPWWETTPQDYLEKIFNIPFALPRMSPDSFGELVRSIGETEAAEPGDAEAARAPAHADPAAEAVPLPELAAIPVEARSEVAALATGAPEPEVRPITADELTLLSALAPLVGSPREAKRLMNLYRIIRSTRDLSPAARFLGDPATPGEYQAVVVLLGLLSGHARLLHDVLVAVPAERTAGGLRQRPPGDGWADFVAGMRPRGARPGWRNDVVGRLPDGDVGAWLRLADGLAGATKLVTLPDLVAFQLWAPRIARFSFLLSPYTDHEPAAAQR